MAFLLPGLVLKEELVVSPDEVRKRRHTPWGSTGGKALPADEVEEVIVGKHPSSPANIAVRVVADDVTLSFGSGLPRSEQDWVRDCVIAVISRGTAGGSDQ